MLQHLKLLQWVEDTQRKQRGDMAETGSETQTLSLETSMPSLARDYKDENGREAG